MCFYVRTHTIENSQHKKCSLLCQFLNYDLECTLRALSMASLINSAFTKGDEEIKFRIHFHHYLYQY